SYCSYYVFHIHEYKPKIKGDSVNGEFLKDFYNFVEDETNVHCAEWYMNGRVVEVNNVEELVAAVVSCS
ncbi:hypothetical protein MKW92_012346, partial [Papaver armeniacum]